MTALNIVFAGTPAFTCPALDAITASNHHLSALYTQPDRPKGRGRTVQASAAKQWAEAHDVPVYQPLNFKTQAAKDDLIALAPDVLVVIAYGLILPPEVLSIPRLGCINVHASLLPKWRGAAPIQYSVLHGDKTTGVSIMQMDAGMDTGPVFKTASCPIGPHTTSGELYDQLSTLAAAPLISVLDALASNTPIKAITQTNQLASYAPKITKQDAIINWTQPATHIAQQIQAFNPWPIARTNAGDEVLRVHQATTVNQTTTELPGTILDINKTGIFVATGLHILQIRTIQFAGGKALTLSDWLNANKQTLYPGLILK
ncbi:MAG: methionyl-tRNA formyltransferase [Gammaproteobacteria bacterium]|nr:methionyl-tRNA formyltransferase [Gammaproteobacteria bacterium]MCH9717173.1 methionyl-tRNA formyltransferase [Gammaproteobacteria bacterium]MCH9762859.1 methionyl-tRNA formyltransferase [Gammaproteobacteria bacterium]